MGKECLQRQGQTAGSGQRHHLDSADRVAAESEEVLVGIDQVELQHLCPDPDQDLFRRRSRRVQHAGVAVTRRVRRGEGLAVDLAVARQGNGIQLEDRRRHHVVGEAVAEKRAQLLGHCHPRGGDDVADQSGSSPIVTKLRHRLGHGRMASHGGLDLAQLDAMAPQLHLLIDAAPVLQVAIG